MAANSLLLFLLTTGLTTPPDESVTTESNFDANTREDAAEWHGQTRWPGFGGEPQDYTITWRQETGYTTQYPYNQFTDSSVIENANTREDAAQWQGQTRWPGFGSEPQDYTITWRQEQGYTTEHPYNQFTDSSVTESENADVHQTEEPLNESEDRTYQTYNWRSTTEETEEETEQPQVRSERKRKRCPSREHYTRCHKNCEKTCSNYRDRKPCPRSCQRGCVCDGALVRNDEGKCVPRDQCPKSHMADQYVNSHSCPDEYSCNAHCVRIGQRNGTCEEDICKCHGR